MIGAIIGMLVIFTYANPVKTAQVKCIDGRLFTLQGDYWLATGDEKRCYAKEYGQ